MCRGDTANGDGGDRRRYECGGGSLIIDADAWRSRLCTEKLTYRGGRIAANHIRSEAGIEGESEGEISFQWILDSVAS